MKRINQLFPLLAIIFSTITFWFPEFFVVQKPLIVPLLMLVMLGMGLTLEWQDFRNVAEHPWLIALGVGLQYFFMPLLALGASVVMQLPEEWYLGMILVGATAGGTASNVICHLSGGWVALSVSMTLVSTLCSVFATPFLTWLYLGERVEVPFLGMMQSIFQIVILPILIGVLVNMRFRKTIEPIKRFSPVLSVVGIIWIIGIIVALNAENLRDFSWQLVGAIIIHNGGGLLTGYWVTRFFTRNESYAKTIAIEVGMQNSGMSVVLANQFFTTAAALPGALFSIWHNISGSIVAAIWSRSPVDKELE